MGNVIYYLGDFDPVTSKDFALCERVAASTGSSIVFLPSPTGLLSFCEALPKQRETMLSLALSSINNPLFSMDSSLLNERSVPQTLERLKLMGKENVAFLLKDVDASTLTSKGLKGVFSGRDVILSSSYEEEPPLGYVEQSRGLTDPCLGPSLWPYIEKERLYYANRLASFLKSEHRLQHSLSVGNLAYEIAKANHLPNPTSAYVAGVLHDLGKHCPREQERAIIDTFFPSCSDFPEWAFHQFTGGYLAEKEFGIEAPEILDAIKSHATGKANMSALGKIIYSADKIDPLRGYDSSWMINKCRQDYENGFLTVLRENRDYLTKKGYRVDNPLTRECFEMYLKD